MVTWFKQVYKWTMTISNTQKPADVKKYNIHPKVLYHRGHRFRYEASCTDIIFRRLKKKKKILLWSVSQTTPSHNPPDKYKLPFSPCYWKITVLVNGKVLGMLPRTCDTHTHTHRNGALVAKVSAFSRQNKGVWKGLGNCRRMCISAYTVELTWRQLLRAQFKSTTGEALCALGTDDSASLN